MAEYERVRHHWLGRKSPSKVSGSINRAEKDWTYHSMLFVRATHHQAHLAQLVAERRDRGRDNKGQAMGCKANMA